MPQELPTFGEGSGRADGKSPNRRSGFARCSAGPARWRPRWLACAGWISCTMRANLSGSVARPR